MEYGYGIIPFQRIKSDKLSLKTSREILLNMDQHTSKNSFISFENEN
jgi:hypothetical protein